MAHISSDHHRGEHCGEVGEVAEEISRKGQPGKVSQK
jgi:hypothetical protein